MEKRLDVATWADDPRPTGHAAAGYSADDSLLVDRPLDQPAGKPESSVRWLVCEGACNPRLAAWDACAADGLAPAGSLAHTAHRPLGGPAYACAVCGHRRKF